MCGFKTSRKISVFVKNRSVFVMKIEADNCM